MYTNTGYQRATKLTITIRLNGVVQSTTNFPLMEAFLYNGISYSAVSTLQIQQMSTDDYINRVNDYAAYVQANYQSQYPGLTVSSNGSRIYNDVSCPI